MRNLEKARWLFMSFLGFFLLASHWQLNNSELEDRALDIQRDDSSLRFRTSSHQNTRLPVSPAIRDKLWEQQHQRCIERRGMNGFQMADSVGCWTTAMRKMVTRLDATSLYSETFEVALDPLTVLKDQHIRVMGDSISRYFFTALYFILLQQSDTSQTIEPKFKWDESEYHGSMRRSIPGPANITMEWHWAPGSKEVRGFFKHMSPIDLKEAHHNVIIIGNWYRTHTREKWFRDSYKKLLREIRGDWPELNDLVIQTPPRHPRDAVNDTLQQEQSFNLWWAHEISSSQNSSTHGEAQTVPVVNGFWPFQVGDQEDGIHSITHAMYSSFLHMWRWRWLKVSDETLRVFPLEKSVWQEDS